MLKIYQLVWLLSSLYYIFILTIFLYLNPAHVIANKLRLSTNTPGGIWWVLDFEYFLGCVCADEDILTAGESEMSITIGEWRSGNTSSGSRDDSTQ